MLPRAQKAVDCLIQKTTTSAEFFRRLSSYFGGPVRRPDDVFFSDILTEKAFVADTISGPGRRLLIEKQPCSHAVNIVSLHALLNSVN